MTLVEKIISDVWDLFESSRPNGRKERSSVIKNIQKRKYYFGVLKVMTVGINACMRAYTIYSALAQRVFSSTFLSKVKGLPNSLLALTHKLSYISIPEMQDSMKF